MLESWSRTGSENKPKIAVIISSRSVSVRPHNKVGELLGERVLPLVGSTLGSPVGIAVGELDGNAVGKADGFSVGE